MIAPGKYERLAKHRKKNKRVFIDARGVPNKGQAVRIGALGNPGRFVAYTGPIHRDYWL
jgi:hypothetical protein